MLSSLVDRYKSLLGRGENRPEADPALNRAYLELFQAQREHHFVDVQIDGDDAVYQSMILALDPEEKTLLIDELFPKGFVGLPGQQVHLTIRQPKGRKVKFSTTILEQYLYEDSPVYVLSMPQTLDADQRRNAYRLPIGGGISIQPAFVGPDNRSYQAHLRNLSSTGAAVELDVDDPDRFREEGGLSHVAFDFAGMHVDCDMAVRNVSVEPERNKVRIGAEFVDLPPLDQRSLERSIMRVQRDRLRHGGEMEARLASA